MEINNFKIISDQFIFDDKNDFYYVQIIKRKKDGHDINGNNRTRLVKSYCIKSKEDLFKREDEIIKLSNLFNARVYIHMTSRNSKSIMEQALITLPERYISKHYNLINLYDTLCGKIYNKKHKTFLIDLDEKDLSKKDSILEFIKNEFNLEPKMINRSVSGLHLIFKPFNTKIFIDKYPEIDIQKNNPTILYYNKIENEEIISRRIKILL